MSKEIEGGNEAHKGGNTRQKRNQTARHVGAEKSFEEQEEERNTKTQQRYRLQMSSCCNQM